MSLLLLFVSGMSVVTSAFRQVVTILQKVEINTPNLIIDFLFNYSSLVLIPPRICQSKKSTYMDMHLQYCICERVVFFTPMYTTACLYVNCGNLCAILLQKPVYMEAAGNLRSSHSCYFRTLLFSRKNPPGTLIKTRLVFQRKFKFLAIFDLTFITRT